MPLVACNIKEQHKSIIRPAVIDVINQLLPVMEIPSDTEIIFNGYSEMAMLPNGKIGVDNRHLKKPIRTAGTRRLFVGFEEERTSQTVTEMPVYYPEQIPVFVDKALGIYIRPVRKQTSVTLTFNQRFQSKTAADQWQSRMESLLAQYVQDQIHHVTYQYAIPDQVISALYKMWTLRESVAPYNESFSEWLLTGTGGKLTSITGQDGKQLDLAFTETMDNVQGWWEFEAPPYPTKANNLGSWQAEFTYRFEMEKVIRLAMNYPISIHNQPLPMTLISKLKDPTYRRTVYQKPLQQFRFEKIQTVIEGDPTPLRKYPTHPDFDDWIPDDIPGRLIPQYSALLFMDLEKPTEVVNLKQLGPYRFTDLGLSYINLVKSRVLYPAGAIIQVRVYQGEIMMDPLDFTLRDDLTVVCNHPLNPRETYHVMVLLDANLAGLNEATVSELLQLGKFTESTLAEIFPDRVNSDDFVSLNENGEIDRWVWDKFVRSLMETQEWCKRTMGEMLTTGSFTICTRSNS